MFTPCLDRMSLEGTSFRRTYVASSSSTPSRASLFTGLYPHTNGVFRTDERRPRTWVGKRRDSGYRCVNIGEMHTSPYDPPPGDLAVYEGRIATPTSPRSTGSCKSSSIR